MKMTNSKGFLALVLWLLLLVVPASAERMVGGVVAYTDGDYVIFYTRMGYAVAEYYGGYYVLDEDDRVVGDIDSFGFKDIYCPAKDRSVRVYIDNYMLSRDRALEWLFEKKN